MSSFGHLDSYITRPFPSILHELNLERGTDPDIHSGREQSFFGWSETRLDPFFRDQLVIVEPFMTLCFTDDDQYQIQYLVKQPTDIVRAVDLLRNDWNLQACVVASSIVQNERSQESNYVTSQRLRLALHKRRHPIQHRSQVTISLLGTGSASPSRHRSNSAILVDISDSTSSSSILLDAGESCMAQLFYSCHGDANYMRSILQSLSVVWISHHHADHHCGLSLLLEETFRIQRTKKLIVIAPQSVISYHQYISCVCGIDDIVEFLPIELTVPCYPSLPECFIKAQNEIALSTNNIIRELQSIRVQHCHDSFGVILKLSTHQKIVYSGDCRPSKHLVALGTNCDILIHEATFDDDKITDARSKRHSTISEGIQIGSDMAANHTILTHFSQRYPRTPAVSNANVTIAHDFLKVTMLK